MVYRVIIEETAQEDAVEYADFMIQKWSATEAAAKWLDGLEEALQVLAEMPRKFKVIDEQAHFQIELRQFLYHSHRVVFHVNDDTGTVHVLRVYHGARDELQP